MSLLFWTIPLLLLFLSAMTFMALGMMLADGESDGVLMFVAVVAWLLGSLGIVLFWFGTL